MNTIPQRSYKDGFQDRPTPRPNSDVVREKRHSPRSPEEVDLALTAIWSLYHFIDGVGSKKECLDEHMNCMHLLYERYLEETITDAPTYFGPSISSLLSPGVD
jgi:hypothetical protein